MDIMKFLSLYCLVLFAFSCGKYSHFSETKILEKWCFIINSCYLIVYNTQTHTQTHPTLTHTVCHMVMNSKVCKVPEVFLCVMSTMYKGARYLLYMSSALYNHTCTICTLRSLDIFFGPSLSFFFWCLQS